ncbi:hypothetical protein PTKIN_Ptkin02bG0099000 [Pterospermum kingtungense]
MATSKALLFPSQIGFQDIILEGDALGVVNRLCSKEDDFSNVGNIMEEGRVLTRLFNICCIQHISKDVNKVTHRLAKLGVNCHEESIWVKEYSSEIHEIILVDVSRSVFN